MTVKVSQKKKGKASPSGKKKAKILQEDVLIDNNQLNKARKVAYKKLKKERKRAGMLSFQFQKDCFLYQENILFKRS